MTDLQTLTDETRITKRDLDALVALLGQAQAIQWQAPPRKSRPSFDTTEKASAVRPADPTADVALDDRRLAVRAAVERAIFFLRRRTPADLAEITSALQAAIDAWEGDPEEGDERHTPPGE